jgi:flagellar basal body rod protein FlgG
MDSLTAAAASGMRARLESLDLLANNLANASTSGYKTDREFYGLYLDAEANLNNDSEFGAMPVIENRWTDYAQGTLTPTGNPLHAALSGRGFFAVNGPSGTLYTRSGEFRVSAAGVLTTQEGYPVKVTGGGQIQVRPGMPFEISTDGTVRQSGNVLGVLEVIDFPEGAPLVKQGATFFRPADPQLTGTRPAGLEVHQHKLENSNVSSAESAVRLIHVMRQFEMLQKAVTIGADMNRKAIEDVARVGS